MDFARKTLSTVTERLYSLGIGVITSIIVVRGLSPDQYGTLNVIITFPATITSVFILGIHSSHVYYISKNKADAGHYFTNTNIYVACISFIVVGIWLIFFKSIAQAYNPEIDPKWFYYSLAIFPFLFYRTLTPSILRGLYQISSFNLIQYATSTLKFILYAVLIFALGLGLQGALAANVLMHVLVCVLLVVLILRHKNGSLAPSWNRFKQSLSLGWKLHIAELAAVGRENLKVLIIGSYYPLSDLGHLMLANNLAMLLNVLIRSVNISLLPKLSAEDPGRARHLTERVLRFTLLLTGGNIILIAIAAPYLVPLIYGKDYAASSLLILILLPGHLSVSYMNIIYSYLVSIAETNLRLIIPIISLTLNLLAMGIAIAIQFDVAGVAILLSVANILSSVLAAYFFLRLNRSSKVRDIIIPTADDIHFARETLKGLIKRRRSGSSQ